MNKPKMKPHYSVSQLKASDQKEIEALEAAIQNLLSEQTLRDYVFDRKGRCDLGITQAKLLEERERTFISFLREQAEEYVEALIEEKIMSYENDDNGLYKIKAMSSINKGKPFAFKFAAISNK